MGTVTSRWAICRSRPAGVGCGFARGRATPTREVPLNSVCRHAIDEWTTARTDQVAAGAATSSPPAASAALWLSRSESRISARVIDLVIRRLAKDAHLELVAVGQRGDFL
jgi:site-specific recombinase XerD